MPGSGLLARRLAAPTATSGPGGWRRALVPSPGPALSMVFHRVLAVVAFPDRLAAREPPCLGRMVARAAAGRPGASSLSVVCPARWRFQPADPPREVTGQSRSHNSDRIGRLEEEPSDIVDNSSRCSFSSTTYSETTRGKQARLNSTELDAPQCLYKQSEFTRASSPYHQCQYRRSCRQGFPSARHRSKAKRFVRDILTCVADVAEEGVWAQPMVREKRAMLSNARGSVCHCWRTDPRCYFLFSDCWRIRAKRHVWPTR